MQEVALRSAVLLVIVAFMLSPPSVAADDPIALFSFQDTSCGAWAKSAHDKLGRAQYDSWFRGFVSGYNFGNPTNQVQLERMPDPDTLALYVDKYCRENPLNPFVSAALDLVRELRAHPESTRKPDRK
jgi:hypothetical protein